MGLEPRKSIGTSSFVVLATSASAVCSYIYEGLTSFRAAAAIGVTAMVSARIGATMTNKVKPKTLKKGFGAWLMIVSVVIFAKAMKLLPVSWWPVLKNIVNCQPFFQIGPTKYVSMYLARSKESRFLGHGQMEKSWGNFLGEPRWSNSCHFSPLCGGNCKWNDLWIAWSGLELGEIVTENSWHPWELPLWWGGATRNPASFPTWDVYNPVNNGIFTTNLNWFSRRILNEPSTVIFSNLQIGSLDHFQGSAEFFWVFHFKRANSQRWEHSPQIPMDLLCDRMSFQVV